MPPKKKKFTARQRYQDNIDALNTKIHTTVQPHNTGKYGPGNPPPPSAQPEKGTIGLDRNKIRQLKQQEAEALREQQEKWREKIQEEAKIQTEKIEKEQKEKELKEWNKKKPEIEGLIDKIKIDKFSHGLYEMTLSQIESPSKEIHPHTWEERGNMAKELKDEYDAYSKRKKEKEKKEKKEQEEKEEKDKLNPLIDEVDNFISNTLNMNTYENFVEIKGIKDLESEIQQQQKTIMRKLTKLSFKTDVRKEKEKKEKDLRIGYTNFLKELNAKERELQDKIDLEKRLIKNQKIQEENARIEARKAAAAEKEAKRKLAWMKKKNDEKKARELKQQAEARKKKENEDKQRRLIKHRQKIMVLRKKFKQSVISLLGKTVGKRATAASREKELQKIKNERNDLLIEISKSEEEKKGNVFVEDLIIKQAEIIMRKSDIDEQADSVDEQNLLSQYNKLLVDAQNHNTNREVKSNILILNSMPTPSAKETKRLLIVPDPFINLIKGKINGLKIQIKLKEKQRIANSIKEKQEEELQLINKFLESKKSLHSPNIHEELYKSTSPVASFARKWKRNTKRNKK